MIEVQNLCKRFGTVQALAGASFTARDGVTTALLGPNGAGKTPLRRTRVGLLQRDHGTVFVEYRAHREIIDAMPGWHVEVHAQTGRLARSNSPDGVPHGFGNAGCSGDPWCIPEILANHIFKATLDAVEGSLVYVNDLAIDRQRVCEP